MKIGIISGCVRQTEKRLLKRVSFFELNRDIAAAEVDISGKKTEKSVSKAEKLLKKWGAEKIIYSAELQKNDFQLSEVFYRYAPNTVKQVAERFKIDAPFKLYIKEKTVDEKAEKVIKSLLYDFSRVAFLTGDFCGGRKTAESLIEEYGVFAELITGAEKTADGICVDLDSGEITVMGKWLLYDFFPEEQLFGYNINPLEMYEASGKDFFDLTAKECKCGKNKLTLD